MKKNWQYFLKFLITCVLLFSSACFADVSANNATSFLFIQDAKSGILQVDKDNPKRYKFILHDVKPYVIYFSDRPKRVSGLITPEKFVKLWQKNPKNSYNFSQIAPNVGVNAIKVHHIFNKQDMSFVMVLNNPVYNKEKRTVIYDANFVSAENKTALPANNTRFRDVVLFFDNIMNPCTDSNCCPLC